MIRLVDSVASMRPDAVAVWREPQVNRRLFWYRHVMTGRFPANFILCRKIPTSMDLDGATEEELWNEHAALCMELSELVRHVDEGSVDGWDLQDHHPNLLELKSELVKRMLDHCNFCEWNCRVNRAQGKIGFCRLDKTTSVGSYFHHYGEEAPLIGVRGDGGSGTIFFESCNAHCVFCQNWDISQPKSKENVVGEIVSPARLAQIADNLLLEGAANINYVGGEPTVDLHTIVDSFKYMKESGPLIWNSNMYCTIEAMNILGDVIDLWLPDFKFWKDECAGRLMWVGAKASYPDVVKRNHVFAADHGSMIIRHLVMPNHLECCTKPILEYIAKTIGDKVLVNVMAQYYPANLVTRNPEKYPDIARYPSKSEIQEAYAYARSLGLQFEQVS
jgi:putative pyruvate formate lyase activating enzyme